MEINADPHNSQQRKIRERIEHFPSFNFSPGPTLSTIKYALLLYQDNKESMFMYLKARMA